MNQRSLVKAIRSGYARFRKLLAGLDPAQIAAPAEAGEWSVKDTLAHILVHEERMLRWIDERLSGRLPAAPQPYGMPDERLDEINRRIFEENRDLPLDEILAGLDEFHALALELVRGAAERDLFDPTRFQLEGGEALWQAVAANTYEHYQEHARDLRARLPTK
jgi:hypothetical protein